MGKNKEPEKPSTAWMGTYGDMITLMLCFFVMLYNPSEIDVTQLATITESLQMTQDSPTGGMSLSAGRLADLGNVISSLPSVEKGKSLGLAKKKAVSLLAPLVNSNKITITSDERGVVISLLSDTYFRAGSADLDIDECRDTLLKLSEFLNDPEIKKRRYRLEGHTDGQPLPEDSKFESNWELSSQRAINVLYFLADFGVDENKFSVAGYADTRPKFSEDTPESRAYNRRVDLIILDEAHF